MCHSKQVRLERQIKFLRRQYLQGSDLPLSDVLSKQVIVQALAAIDSCWKQRIYSPIVTLWIFLGQVLNADHSCRSAVARLIADRVANGLSRCSSATGAYCQARKRLPEKFISTIAYGTGRELESKVDPNWRWKGRHVYMFDGSTVSMPDTAPNQEEYPQIYNQKPGVGFPLARLGVIISLACGAVLDLKVCSYSGKGTGELSLFKRLWGMFNAGDVVLTDCLMCSWTELVMLNQRGVDSVTRLNKARRSADFRRGKRLGKDDHIVCWPKPMKPRAMDKETFNALPDGLTIREVRIKIEKPGFRTKTIVVVTTILDPSEASKEDLAELYRQRWNNELDLRSIKTTMQMEVLRCKTPEMVRKEIWTHVLAYNLIRTIMAQAATKHDVLPRTVSFKATIQTLEAFQPLIAFQKQRRKSNLNEIFQHVIDIVVVNRVADRPDRFEPRRKKRRPKPYDRLMKPRNEVKREMLKGNFASA